MKVRAHVYIEGWVQGVFFRAHTRDLSRKHGVIGWVKNLPDGRVESVFEGERENVEKMVEWCHKGPPQASVQKVDIIWENYSGNYKSFDIRY